jgi:threonine dehydratase
MMISFLDIIAARNRIKNSIVHTPLSLSLSLTKQLGASAVYLKLDNLQRTGSFKDRGAANKIACLTPEQKALGVTAASAGNHAQAVAFHASLQGLKCRIVMPEMAPLTKVSRTRAHGAEVVLFGESLYDSMAEALRLREKDGMVFIHPFDDPLIMAGQGTCGLEIAEQEPNVDIVITPIGGGGLAAGVALALKNTVPNVRVIGVQTERVPSMIQAMAEGKPTLVSPASTIADGIAVRNVGALTLPMVQKYVDDIVAVDEEEIASAILYLLEKDKTLAEGAGAVAVAALLSGKIKDITGKKIACLVGGGNIDVNFLSFVIERGLTKDGRMLRLRVIIPDHPGGLNKLTACLASHKANVLQVVHDRSHFGVPITHTAIEITCETKGWEHADRIMSALRELGCKPEAVT